MIVDSTIKPTGPMTIHQITALRKGFSFARTMHLSFSDVVFPIGALLSQNVREQHREERSKEHVRSFPGRVTITDLSMLHVYASEF
jgi:hypothetical protein